MRGPLLAMACVVVFAMSFAFVLIVALFAGWPR